MLLHLLHFIVPFYFITIVVTLVTLRKSLFYGCQSSVMKIGQNWPFAFWPKLLNFEYSRKKRYFSANRLQKFSYENRPKLALCVLAKIDEF
ncbi:hypothetical protein P5673_009235 [Acropora cervicornis]|uniref:Uncharacterized protein n=1 Tax=Acropora cervicornis TaxID=6130 RepID=A0AAD9QT32_ACRCE|nr:hypothetical protein P5673_009235 [Acropora cervicornis]